MALKEGRQSTELGFLPMDWKVQSCVEFSDPVRGGSPRPAGDPRYFNGRYIPWLTVAGLTNISEAEMFVTRTDTYLTEEGSRHSRILQEGTLIIANSGATLGIAKILGIRCCANDGIAALLNLSKEISPLYLAYYINTRTKYLREVVATGNGQPNLNTQLIGNFKVPIPPNLGEQESIAKALSDIDKLIESLEKLISKKRFIRKGAIQELLSGKRRLPGFSKPWLTKKLADIGSFLKGSGIRKDQAASGSIPCVRYGEIYTAHHDFIREFKSYISSEVSETATKIKYGDLLFAGSGETKEEIGKCVAVTHKDESFAGGDIVILRPTWGHSLFLGYYLNTSSIASQKASRGQGDAVVHISAHSLGSISILVPDIDEQEAIAAVLADIDKEIDNIEQNLKKARFIKQGMMQELLTGRIRLI